MQTVFYARVSTADQTIAHQEKQAKDAGFAIDRVVADHGVSGVSTRLAERPEGKRLCAAAHRKTTEISETASGSNRVSMVTASM